MLKKRDKKGSGCGSRLAGQVWNDQWHETSKNPGHDCLIMGRRGRLWLEAISTTLGACRTLAVEHLDYEDDRLAVVITACWRLQFRTPSQGCWQVTTWLHPLSTSALDELSVAGVVI